MKAVSKYLRKNIAKKKACTKFSKPATSVQEVLTIERRKHKDT